MSEAALVQHHFDTVLSQLKHHALQSNTARWHHAMLIDHMHYYQDRLLFPNANNVSEHLRAMNEYLYASTDTSDDEQSPVAYDLFYPTSFIS